ncbi:MAG: N-acetyl-gamma-glutamyl-phosphate reductase [Euryarchaeota archaeon]|nr:N-acetyl-gamma-glutamyl-phosphate reductase [Euryarchaeota archaeon]
MKTRVAVIGATGYTGGELLRFLVIHPKVEIRAITSREPSKLIYDVHPALRGFSNIKFENISPKEVSERVEFVFVATPHGVSMEVVPDLISNGVRVVDLSADYRLDDVSIFERTYGIKHKNPTYKAVYGLPELHRDEIRKAKLVANPGCFPTGAILAAAPAVEAGIVEHVIFDSKTGSSGAGRTPSEFTHHPELDENVKAYKVATHRHAPEMEQELNKLGKVKVSFTPHLVPVIRGILTTSHLLLSKEISSQDLQKMYFDYYRDEPFVRVLNFKELPSLSSVKGSNFCDIGCFEIDTTGRAIVISAIDNLVKGASGQAIQNMNIMLGFDETLGLMLPGLRP